MAGTPRWYTPISQIKDVHARLNKTLKSGVTLPTAYRRSQLLGLARMAKENQKILEEAQLADLGKQPQELMVGEIAPVYSACMHALKHLDEWVKPSKPKVEDWRSSWDTTVYPQPKGVAMIIAPWNYPFLLSYVTMVGAVAAGCPVVVKPSELTPATAQVMAELLPKYMDPNSYAIVNGGVEETKALLELRWAHILFTGSTNVGKIVAQAAAKHITPLTLELGSKSPVIVAPDADLDLAAKRILFGKVQNVGQLCVSPDHVFVPKAIAPQFYEALKRAYAEQFPIDPLDPRSNWGRIVNEPHFNRVKAFLEQTKGKIIIGGGSDKERLRIAMTVVADVKLDDLMMQEEIFGPILPVVEVDDVDQAVDFISNHPTPLVIYCFSNKEDVKTKVLEKTASGTVVMNDTYMNLAVYEMPFGGHGLSGYGVYQGKYSFDAFTHTRSYINVPPSMEDFWKHRYLPYSEESMSIASAPLSVPPPAAP